jgi:1-deoxy-D-xylulose-5-phosphate reductoisomerase
MKTRNIVLLGSTGSIGKNALKVIASNRDRFKLISLAAGENIGLLKKQIVEFQPDCISVKLKRDADILKKIFPDKKIFFGGQGLEELVGDERADTVIAAINGTSALEATMVAIRNNRRICLANKETLVAAGEMINRELSRSRAELIPIDSEQSAIFQSIGCNKKESIRKVILTASGGPFHNRDENFSNISLREALWHPTWSMGKKITLDSATLMNKALEIIETFYLFGLKKEQIDVVVHPQSIVHSLVEFVDSSLIAQLSIPDMKIPILYSLTFPERGHFESRKFSLAELQELNFYAVDRKRFKSIEMAYYVLEKGKNSGAVLNAANEVAAGYFLKEMIKFADIFNVVEKILYQEKFYPVRTLSDLMESIEQTKNKTIDLIERRMRK